MNYFSLDIEGAELQVLRSLPWKLVDIEVRNMQLADSRGCLFSYASCSTLYSGERVSQSVSRSFKLA